MGNREGDAFDVYPMTSCTMPTGTSALPGSSSVPLPLFLPSQINEEGKIGNREGDAFYVYPMTSCTMPTGTSALPGSLSVPLPPFHLP